MQIKSKVVTPCGTVYNGRVISGQRSGTKLLLTFEVEQNLPLRKRRGAK